MGRDRGARRHRGPQLAADHHLPLGSDRRPGDARLLDEPGHAVRTDHASVGFKIGELDGRDTERARRLATTIAAPRAA